jgi:adenine-specific DNA methylase
MIPKECKRLAEVDFPIAVVSRHSAREKAIHHGHPSTLHLWWARRPLAACRAMLMALLLPDPCDPSCPEEFKQRARNILPRVQGKPGAKDIDLRTELLRFIGDFANWENAANPIFVEAARGLVRASHGDEAPLVVDPFAGGGSIPLEALRIGCDAFASDLNPVSCLVLKAMLEDIQRHGPGISQELRELGSQVRAATANDLSQFYPSDPGAKPIAYLWARTISCDNCGAEVPLARSFWLSTKPGRRRALRVTIVKRMRPELRFEVIEPKSEADVQEGTVSRAKATCLSCRMTMPTERVRAQLIAQRGGADVQFDAEGQRIGGATLLAVVTALDDVRGRQYRASRKEDYKPIWAATRHLQQLAGVRLPNGLSPIPDERIPSTELRRISLPLYGCLDWGTAFTNRQKLALATLSRHIEQVQQPTCRELLSFALSKQADFNSSIARWANHMEKSVATFGRQALPILWDWAEVVPISDATGGFGVAVDWIASSAEGLAAIAGRPGQVEMADAAHHPVPAESAAVWFTDPPYYDAVPYSHLADYFYVWLRRVAGVGNATWFKTELCPKDEECVVDRPHRLSDSTKTPIYFQQKMAAAMACGRGSVTEDGIGCIVFAHKTTEGWEALISGIIAGGWIITASWPVATEKTSRLNAQETASLATSVHLVTRPRPEDAPIGDWGDVFHELPHRVGDWIERLQTEGIKGADLVFACIGPAMEIYSRYRRVEDAEGREIPLGGDPTATEPYQRGFLAYVWETVGRLALEEVLGTAEARARNGAAGALEEDARLTALFLWTMQSTQTDAETGNDDEESDDEGRPDDEDGAKQKKKLGYTLIYDVARRFAQPLGIHLEKWEGRIIETEKGIVRLLPVTERSSQLFGEADAAAIAQRIEADVKESRNYTFAFMQEDTGTAPEIKSRGRGRKAATQSGAAPAPAPRPVTTLDRLHAAMLLQRSGQTNGLRALLKDEMQRGPDFLRLANALSRLYPKESDEKRLLDAMLLAIPRG